MSFARRRTGGEDHPDKVSPAHPPDTTMVAMDPARIRNGGEGAHLVGIVTPGRLAVSVGAHATYVGTTPQQNVLT